MTFDQLHDALSTEMQLQLETLRTKLYEDTRRSKNKAFNAPFRVR